jgi:hypothetical protein
LSLSAGTTGEDKCAICAVNTRHAVMGIFDTAESFLIVDFKNLFR